MFSGCGLRRISFQYELLSELGYGICSREGFGEQWEPDEIANWWAIASLLYSRFAKDQLKLSIAESDNGRDKISHHKQD